MGKKLFVLVIAILIFHVANAQDWWNDLHGWDSSKPSWQTFMKVSPGFLGINGLPIPEQLCGKIGVEKNELQISSDFHFADGETAQNLFVRGYFRFSDRIAIELWGVPVEHYNYNEQIRNERVSRDEDGKGIAAGDLYFSTQVLVLKEKQWPSVVFRMACKTASGDLAAARFSDTPAYWFDLSAGKNFKVRTFQLRPYGMYGLYVWQTTHEFLLQNDAKLWGGGFELKTKKWTVNNSIQGYNGYFNNEVLQLKWRDKPINYRLKVDKQVGNNVFQFQFQHGIRHTLYDSFRIGWIFRI